VFVNNLSKKKNSIERSTIDIDVYKFGRTLFSIFFILLLRIFHFSLI